MIQHPIVMSGAPGCYLELLDKLQKRICMAVCPSLAVSLEPFAHCRNVASLSLLFFGRCSSELAYLVPQGLLVIPIDCMTICSCYKDVSFNSFFPCTAFL